MGAARTNDEWLVGRRYLSEASVAKALAFGQDSYRSGSDIWISNTA